MSVNPRGKLTRLPAAPLPDPNCRGREDRTPPAVQGSRSWGQVRHSHVDLIEARKAGSQTGVYDGARRTIVKKAGESRPGDLAGSVHRTEAGHISHDGFTGMSRRGLSDS